MENDIFIEKEFDKNYHDEDFDNCKRCGYQFDSFEIMYQFPNVWDGTFYTLCEECMDKLKNKIINGE